ncbi:MAG TPA: anaerobic ribonucleoside-triphosphate reductase activating protein [Candidatus Hydrogenedentes bacterium]|nr:anaerobic ribonucleoside-triphosphate reductase activating protein [Candidatus Hydrogenedentota bacterium]
MRFGGFQPFTLSDYPGHVAAIVFTQGCNFKCPFCHNGDLLSFAPSEKALYPEEEILRVLKQRQGKLEGLVISGGEPTVQPDLPRFAATVKTLGYKIKLDTNGSNPDMLSRLIADRLLDYIAMDIKAPLARYSRLSGVSVSTRDIEKSIALIAGAKLPHHFRTTAVTPLLSPADMQAVRELAPPGSELVVQPFHPENALDPSLRAEAANG